MKKLSFLAVAAIVMMGVALAACDSGKSIGSAKLKSEGDSVSFMIGQSNGAQIRKGFESQLETWPIDGNIDAFIAGIIYGLKNADDSLLLGKDMQAAGDYVNGIFMNAQAKVSEANNAEADAFLAQNGKQSGVFTTESGLQYKVITEGTGPRPTLEDQVKVHYILSYLNGEVVQNSDEFGGSVEFQVGGVIEGWKEGLQLMPVGSKYIFWVRQELAYGPPGTGHPQAGKFLVFEIDLLDIIKE